MTKYFYVYGLRDHCNIMFPLFFFILPFIIRSFIRQISYYKGTRIWIWKNKIVTSNTFQYFVINNFSCLESSLIYLIFHFFIGKFLSIILRNIKLNQLNITLQKYPSSQFYIFFFFFLFEK